MTKSGLKKLGIEDESILDILLNEFDNKNKMINDLKDENQKLNEYTKDFEKIKKENEGFIKIKNDFHNYKNQVENEKIINNKQSLLKEELLNLNFDNTLTNLILKSTDLNNVEISDGVLKNKDDFINSVMEKYGNYVKSSSFMPAEVNKVDLQSTEQPKSLYDLQGLSYKEINTHFNQMLNKGE